jgi:hypothetical protein
MSLGLFARRMAVVSSRMGTELAKAMQDVTIAVDQAVVLGTPVDTGRARSNWIVSRGSATSKKIAPYAPGSKLGLGESGNLQGALDQAKGEVAAYKLSDGDIYISNNVHYIGLLDGGSSAQAPLGITEIGVAAGVSAVNNARIIK